MAVKLKGKQWFSIISPEVFGAKEIGRTISGAPDGLVGKTVNLNAVELTDDINKYYMKFKFKITSVEGDKAYTQFAGSECMQDYISRMVLKRIRRIDTNQELKTKDGMKMRVKSMIIVSKKMKASIVSKIRAAVSDFVKSEVESSTLPEFLEKMLSNEMKNIILKEGRKIYPIRNYEIRKTEVIL